MPADAGPPQPPQPPEPGDCCHSGCEFCVDDMYQGELDRYRVALQAWQERQAALQTTVASPPGAT